MITRYFSSMFFESPYLKKRHFDRVYIARSLVGWCPSPNDVLNSIVGIADDLDETMFVGS